MGTIEGEIHVLATQTLQVSYGRQSNNFLKSTTPVLGWRSIAPHAIAHAIAPHARPIYRTLIITRKQCTYSQFWLRWKD